MPFFFSSRRRHTRCSRDWSSDVCSSDLVVPDETDRIAGKLVRWADSGEVDVILTTGGTGLTARDVTPEATEAVVDRLAPGIAEALRAVAAPKFPRAWLSRGLAGMRGKALIANLPGSTGGVADGLAVLELFLDQDRKSTRLNSSHGYISYAVFCLKKKTKDLTSAAPPTNKRAMP